MKVQWKSVSEEQEMRNSLLRGYRSLIGWCCCLLNMISRLIGWHTFYDLLLICSCCFDWTERDVSRTDRHNTFFSGNDNPGLTLLNDVLMTYCMFNFDLGKPLPLSLQWLWTFKCITFQLYLLSISHTWLSSRLVVPVVSLFLSLQAMSRGWVTSWLLSCLSPRTKSSLSGVWQVLWRWW